MDQQSTGVLNAILILTLCLHGLYDPIIFFIFINGRSRYLQMENNITQLKDKIQKTDIIGKMKGKIQKTDIIEKMINCICRLKMSFYISKSVNLSIYP